jgi:hypothetical protein
MVNEWYYREKAKDPEGFLKKIRERKKELRAEKGIIHEFPRDKNRRKPLKTHLCLRARSRGRKAGLEATIRTKDLHWPECCPVLGIKLDYDTPGGKRNSRNPALPSLDRWDNTKGYIPGNVYVISFRANMLKNNATWDELVRVADYTRYGPLTS